MDEEEFKRIVMEELEGYELTDLGWEMVAEILINEIQENG